MHERLYACRLTFQGFKCYNRFFMDNIICGKENKKLKIALCAVNTRYSQCATALDYLAGYLRKYMGARNIAPDSYEVRPFEFNLGDTHESATRALGLFNADIYGFSVYIWNRDFIKKLIAFIRTAFPESLTVAGGPEVISVCRGDDEAMCGAEFAISGEGEISFARFAELAFDAKKAGGTVRALDEERVMAIDGIARSFGPNGASGARFVYSSEPAVVNDLDELPSIFEKSPYNECGGRGERNFVYLETSRGCPNHCHYCLSSLKPKNAPAVRYFSMARVFADIDRIIDGLGVEKVRVIDRTFNDDPERALEIFKYIAGRARPGTLFQFEISPYKFSAAMLDFLKNLDKSCFQFEIGVQSFNRAALDAVGRENSEPVSAPDEAAGGSSKTARRECATAGLKTHENAAGGGRGGERPSKAGDILDTLIKKTRVNVHADLMYGLPGDDYAGCVASFDTLLKKMPDSVQFWQLKLLRGTRLRENAAAAGLVYDPNPPYAVIKTPSISAAEMFALQKLGRYLDVIYNHGHLKLSVRMLFAHFGRPSDFFFALIDYFQSRGIADTAISRCNLFAHMRGFGEAVVKPAAPERFSILLDCLRYDFISGETKRFSLPDFLKPDKLRRDISLYEKIRSETAGGEMKLSRSFSLFRFDNDIVAAASGTELTSNGSGFALNPETPPRRGAYMAVKHIACPDGTFSARRFWFNDPGDFTALDYFYFAAGNKNFPPAEDGGFDERARAEFLGRFAAIAANYEKKGILVSPNKNKQELCDD